MPSGLALHDADLGRPQRPGTDVMPAPDQRRPALAKPGQDPHRAAAFRLIGRATIHKDRYDRRVTSARTPLMPSPARWGALTPGFPERIGATIAPAPGGGRRGGRWERGSFPLPLP